MEAEGAECCHLCLSMERRLSSLEGVLDVYLLLVGSDVLTHWNMSSLRACWECHAMLRRISGFRKLAQWVRGFLDTAEDILLDSDICLSKLKWKHLFTINIQADNPQQLPEKQNNARSFGCFRPMTNLPCDKDNDNTNKDEAQDSEIMCSVNTNVGLVSFEIKEEKEKEAISEIVVFESIMKALRDENQQSNKVNTTDTGYGHLHTGMEIQKQHWENSVEKGNVVLPYTPISVSQQTAGIKQLSVNTSTACSQKMNIGISQQRQKTALKENVIETKDNVFASKNTIQISQQEQNTSLKKQLSARKIPQGLLIESDLFNSPDSFDNLDEIFQDVVVPAIETKDNVFTSKNTVQISQQEQNTSLKKQLSARKIPQGLLIESDLFNRPDSFDNLDEIFQDVVVPAIETKDNVFTSKNTIQISQEEQNTSLKEQLSVGKIPEGFLIKSDLIYIPVSFENADEMVQEAAVPEIETEVSVYSSVNTIKISQQEQNPAHLPADKIPQGFLVKAESTDSPNSFDDRDEDVQKVVEIATDLNRPENWNVERKNIQMFMNGIKVTESQLMDFLKKTRNDYKYLASPYKCKYCILGFNNISSLHQHMDTYKHNMDSKGAFICKICDRRMPTKKDLDDHFTQIHQFLYLCLERDFVSVCPVIVGQHYLEKHTVVTDTTTPLATHQQILRNPNRPLQAQNTGSLERETQVIGQPHAPVKNLNISYSHIVKHNKGHRISKVTKFEVFKPSQKDIENLKLSCKKAKWSCLPCCVKFPKENLLVKHSKLHSKEAGAYMCDVCTLRFTSECHLNEHRVTHDQWYRCLMDPKCKHVSTNWRNMRTHGYNHFNISKKNPRYEAFKPTEADMETLRGLLSYLSAENRCEDCCNQFVTEQDLCEHGKLHEEAAGAYACNMCKLRFTSEPLLAEHESVHEEWYRCKADPTCLHIAQTYQHMQKHLTAKHRTKQPKRTQSFQCNICAKVFLKKGALVTHLLIHDKRNVCEVCGLRYVTRNLLMKHKRNKHTNEEQNYTVCEFCPKRFTHISRLQYHRNIHLNIKPFACKQCDKMFSSPTHRSAHVNQVHLKKKPYLISLRCSVCYVTFTNKWDLCKHVQTHRELRKFKCEKCPKSFVTFNNFVDHQLVHTEEKNHQCHICNRKFTFLSNLKLHIYRTHKKPIKKKSVEPRTSIKNWLFVCAECGKQFKSTNMLREHLKTHLIFPDV